MTTFQYTAIDPDGKRFAGVKSAENLTVLESTLQKDGIWLLKAHESSNTSSKKASFAKSVTKPKRWDLINFYSQLSLLLDAGVTLPSSLEKLASDLSDDRIGPIAERLSKEVESGTPLSTAMKQFPSVFSSQTTALIEAGESSGSLPTVMNSLARNLEWIDGLLATVRQALIYPIAVTIAATGLVALLFTVVIPKFDGLFKELSIELPLITQIVLGISEGFVSTWEIWSSAIVLLILFFIASKKVHAIAALRDSLSLKIPFFGEIIRSFSLAQFCLTLEMLLKAGVPLVRGLELCAKQAQNIPLKTALESARKTVLEGNPLSEEMHQHSVFPQMFITMTQTGEKSGSLDEVLRRIAEYYNTVIPRKIKVFFGVFEPATIIGLTALVGGVSLALILPLTQLWNVS